MRSKVTALQVASAFDRVLEALAGELIDSTDEELLEAARDLGMDPTMRGSAAFIGLRYPVIWKPADFFELPPTHPLRIAYEGRSAAVSPSEVRSSGRKPRRKPPGRRGKGA